MTVILAALVTCVLLGAVAGWALVTLTRTDPSRAETAQPLTASGPRLPTQAPEEPYADDVALPTLQPKLDYRPIRIGSDAYAWRGTVPRGWLTTVIGPNENTYVPPDSEGGGYGLRLELVLGQRLSPQALVDQRLVAFRSLFEDVHVLLKTADTIKMSYRDPQANWLRFNTFRWIPDANGTAAVEVSVAGREQDLPGLDDLLETVSASVRPAD